MSIILFIVAIISYFMGDCVSDAYMVICALFSIADALWLRGGRK